MEKIDEIFQKKQLIVIGICHYYDKDEIKLFAEERNLRFPILLDPEDIIRKKMAFRTSPLRILLDTDNKILEIAMPNANLQNQKSLLKNLKILLSKHEWHTFRGIKSKIIN